MGTGSTLELSVLVVGYDSASFLPACLDAIGNATARIESETLFINNGSDASEELIFANFPWVRILESRGNIGFAKATNLLADRAMGHNILLLNPDTIIDTDAVEHLLAAANRNKDVGIFGGTTFVDRQSQQRIAPLELPSTRALIRGAFRRRESEGRILDGDTPRIINATSGGFMLVRRQVWRELHGLDQRFFLYAEDLDLCKRAIDAGFKIDEISEATVYHAIGSGNPSTFERQVAIARGNATYHLKHFSAFRALLHIGLMWLGYVTRTIRLVALLPFTTSKGASVRTLATLAFCPWRWVSGYHNNRR